MLLKTFIFPSAIENCFPFTGLLTQLKTTHLDGQVVGQIDRKIPPINVLLKMKSTIIKANLVFSVHAWCPEKTNSPVGWVD